MIFFTVLFIISTSAEETHGVKLLAKIGLFNFYNISYLIYITYICLIYLCFIRYTLLNIYI